MKDKRKARQTDSEFSLGCFESEMIENSGNLERSRPPEHVATECLGGLSNQQEIWKSGGFPGHVS